VEIFRFASKGKRAETGAGEWAAPDLLGIGMPGWPACASLGRRPTLGLICVPCGTAGTAAPSLSCRCWWKP